MKSGIKYNLILSIIIDSDNKMLVKVNIKS